MLVAFYDGLDRKLGVTPGMVAKLPDDEKPIVGFDDLPQMPIDELPTIPDDLEIKPLEKDKIPEGQNTPWRHLKSFKQEPNVKPFKISDYLGKDGTVKHTVTLLNIKESGKTVGREGQTRKMPKTNIMVTILKLTPDEIILKEDDLYTFTWHRQRNTWFVVEDK